MLLPKDFAVFYICSKTEKTKKEDARTPSVEMNSLNIWLMLLFTKIK